jgi:malate dehydrogenase (oxaloacetate-decarboxylating)
LTIAAGADALSPTTWIHAVARVRWLQEATMPAVKEQINSSDIEKLLAKAKKPSADAMQLHPFYRGKTEVVLKCAVRDFNDFAIWYTPGVAAPCKAIQADPDLVYEHTNKWNTVAVISDGTRVLGLGDIGPKAGHAGDGGQGAALQVSGRRGCRAHLPGHQGPRPLHRDVLCCSPASAASTWRTSASPSASASWTPCARRRDPGLARRPAGHGLRHPGRPPQRAQGGGQAHGGRQDRLHRLRRQQRGLHAADLRGRRDPTKCFVVDSKGILHPEREDIARRKAEFVDKWRLCNATNAEGRVGGIAEALVAPTSASR